MTDIELVIRIPEEIYKSSKKECDENDSLIIDTFTYAIGNGILLPKEHGRLIDADAFIETMKDASKRQKYKEVLIDDCLTVDDVFKAIIESLQNKGLAEGDTPTIIPAESEDKNEDRA